MLTAAGERAKPGEARTPAILAALEKISGQTLATSREWRKQLANRKK